MTLKAVGYTRVSSAAQTEGASLESQEAEARLYCARRGYEYVRSYSDAGFSGTNVGKRAGLQELHRDAKAGRFDAVVSFDQSRWGRASDAEDLARTLRYDSKVRIIILKSDGTATGDVDPFDLATSEAEESSRSQAAQSLSRNLSEKMPKWIRNSFDAGGKGSGGTVPFGYKRSWDASNPRAPFSFYEPDENAPAVLKAFEMYAEGSSTREVLHFLRRAGAPFKQPHHVVNMLRRPVFTGLWVRGRTSTRTVLGRAQKLYRTNAPDTWLTREALPTDMSASIVPRALWDRVQKRLDEVRAASVRTRKPTPRTNANPFPPGLIRCASCGGPCKFRSTAWGSRTFVCRTRRASGAKFGNPECEGCIRLDVLQQKVLARVSSLLASNFDGDKLKMRGPDPAIAQLSKTIARDQKKLETLADMLAESPSKTLARKVADLEAKIEQDEARLAALQAAAPVTLDLDRIRKVIDALGPRRVVAAGLKNSPQVFRRVCAVLLSAVVVKLKDSKAHYFARQTLDTATDPAKIRKAAEVVAPIEHLGRMVRFQHPWDTRERDARRTARLASALALP